MSRSRLLALSLIVLSSAAALGLSREAHAQVAPASNSVSGSATMSGSYTARVTSGQQFFERAGTYDANVSFTAAVAITGLNILTQSGSYQASGPFTANITAPGVTPFVVTGTYTAAGTFTSGTFTSSGQWVISTGGAASGTHSGGGTYNLADKSVIASGQYDGSVTSSARGPFSIQGPYSGVGSFAVGAMRMSYAEALQTSAISDMLAGIAGLAAASPIAGSAIEMQQTSAPPAAGAAGTFSGGTIAPAGVSIVSFTGTTAQLGTAGAAAKVLTASATINGKLLTYVVGAPSFVNAEFNAAFPTGLSSTLIIVKT